MRRLALVALLLGACSVPTGSETRVETPPGLPPTDPSPAATPNEGPEVTASAAATGTPVLLVTAADVIAKLEQGGLTAGPVAFGGGSDAVASLRGRPRWEALRSTVERDVRERGAADPKAGIGMRHSHRLFDPSWLQSDKTRLELIGVANRADRRPFQPDRCGETRLIYRLAYRSEVDGTAVDSRLPMTFNVVIWQRPAEGETCRDVARRWLAPDELEGPELAAWLVRSGGPLASSRLSGDSLKSVEINAQLLRWPAVVHPSLGGHAEYVLRVFHPDARAGLVPAPLENVPDVDRLSASSPLRRELAAWIAEPDNLARIDEGVAVMPEKFAATRAISVTPRGLGRLGNRPWSQLFDGSDFEDLALDGGRYVTSVRSLLRRLDGLSCQGCHETRSVAGFHLVGEPRDPTRVLDTVLVPTSAHLDGDLERRRRWVQTLAQGAEPDDARPLSDFERIAGGYGAHCGLGDPGFGAWTCAKGYDCVRMDDPDVGTCLPAGGPSAGDPCEFGEMRTRRTAVDDRVRRVQEQACDGGAVCNLSKVGFPGGMCTTGCGSLHDAEACGAIVNLTTFNNCIARRKAFPSCIEKAAFEAGMRRCDTDHRCRDDYICARSPTSPQQGVCLPPYFLFQMRVDGHVL